MSEHSILPSTQARAANTLRAVTRLEKVAARNPAQAIHEADYIEDPSMRASALIAIAKRTQDIGALWEARDLVNTPGLYYGTRIRKLASISFAAVGVDNGFAAETAEMVTSPVAGSELRQQLSVAMTGSIKFKIGSKEQHDLSRYPDFVVASFAESMGAPNPFGGQDTSTPALRVPEYLLATAQAYPLDAETDGEDVLNMFREELPGHFESMMRLFNK